MPAFDVLQYERSSYKIRKLKSDTGLTKGVLTIIMKRIGYTSY